MGEEVAVETEKRKNTWRNKPIKKKHRKREKWWVRT
jgi:hypothetical protein